MTILLVRHGETALNVARVLQPPDTPLGEQGLRQAAAVARWLAGCAPVALVASDLRRAWQTAEAVAAACQLQAEADPLLHERNFGDWRGRRWDSLDVDPKDYEGAPPGGESMADFERRADAAWQSIVARRARVDGPLVVVTHGLLIHRLLLAHARLPAGLSLPERLANTSVSVLAAQPPHEALRVDSTAHLGTPAAPA